MFDPLIHQPLRTTILSVIAASDDGASFRELLEKTGATNGNLASHLRTLEEANYLSVEKSFEGRRPKSCYRLTQQGYSAFLSYIDALEHFVRQTQKGQ